MVFGMDELMKMLSYLSEKVSVLTIWLKVLVVRLARSNMTGISHCANTCQKLQSSTNHNTGMCVAADNT